MIINNCPHFLKGFVDENNELNLDMIQALMPNQFIEIMSPRNFFFTVAGSFVLPDDFIDANFTYFSLETLLAVQEININTLLSNIKYISDVIVNDIVTAHMNGTKFETYIIDVLIDYKHDELTQQLFKNIIDGLIEYSKSEYVGPNEVIIKELFDDVTELFENYYNVIDIKTIEEHLRTSKIGNLLFEPLTYFVLYFDSIQISSYPFYLNSGRVTLSEVCSKLAFTLNMADRSQSTPEVTDKYSRISKVLKDYLETLLTSK